MADITEPRNLSQRRERSYPRVVKRMRHNSYRVKKAGDHGTRHDSPPTAPTASLALTAYRYVGAIALFGWSHLIVC